MPNWCTNTLKISGPKEVLDRFREAARRETEEGTKEFSLDSLYPTPFEDETVSIVTYSLPDWYMWRLEHWGTKWDVVLVYSRILDDGRWEVTFESAWNPPEEALSKIAADWTQLTFDLTYSETGQGFVGGATWSGGELQESWGEMPAKKDLSSV